MTTSANAESDRYYEAQFTRIHQYGTDACEGNVERVKVTQRLAGLSARLFMCATCKRLYAVSDKGYTVSK